MKWVIVGLGNPGQEYEGTRHNVGRELVFLLEKKWRIKNGVALLTPDTYMNQSGRALKGVIKSKKEAAGLVIIRDDLDLPLGRVKMVFGRGTGGHKGVESVRRSVGTDEFIQVKIGISPATSRGKIKKVMGEENVQQFILGQFKSAEKKELKKVYEKITSGLEILITLGRESTMNFLNTK